jgi:hypothetical protein
VKSLIGIDDEKARFLWAVTLLWQSFLIGEKYVMPV